MRKPVPFCRWGTVTLSTADERAVAAIPHLNADRAVGHASARVLRALCRLLEPRIIVEIGTRLGVSCRAMVAKDWIYTCDRSEKLTNFESGVTPYWKTMSTSMLQDLLNKGIKPDLVFYDANVQQPDPEILKAMMRRKTVFAFHDYIDWSKGVRGVQAILPIVPDHRLVVPTSDDPTVAVLAPEAIARELGGC